MLTVYWIFALFGGALAARSTHVLWRGRVSRRWPVADGEVVTSGVRELRRRRMPFYAPEVEYRYAVGAATFTGHRLRFSPLQRAYDTHAEALAELDGMEPGARVAVRHAPGNPGYSVLRPGYATGDAVTLALGAAVAAVSVVLGARG